MESTVRYLALTARERDGPGGARERAARSGPNIAGIEVADDGWPSEVLECAGPGGQFLSEKSTRVNARSGEWHFSQLGWHDSCDAWTAAGCPDALDQAREKVDAILAAHQPLPLGEDVEGALAELRGRALRHDGGSC